MKQKMVYRGFEIKIWDGRGGLVINKKSYLAQITKPPIITFRSDNLSSLKNDIKTEIDRRYSK